MRKILHIDMDCFYAAIEVRDRPELAGQPVAVGGRSGRGVLTTANYEARKFGCRSAMPTFKALDLCPDLVILPPRFDVYREDSQRVREIFGRFTDLVEPLSLDEAYLDVSHLQSTAASVAWEIRSLIKEETGLTASAGIAPNKLLAKIASDWNKPDGQFEIRPEEIDDFMRDLPVKRLSGVGRKMEEKLAAIRVQTCGDLQGIEKVELADRFGKWGLELYELCRGRDARPVRIDRIRKSLSKERTLAENVSDFAALAGLMEDLREKVHAALAKHEDREIKAAVLKLKFADFTQTTAERKCGGVPGDVCRELLGEAWSRGAGKAVRLIGVGVRFADPEPVEQLDLALD